MKVQYKIIRKRGLKRVSLRVKDDKSIVVTAPYSVSDNVIKNFVESKVNWIKKRVDEIELLVPPLAEHTYQEGDQFMVLGKMVTLFLIKRKSSAEKSTLNNERLLIVVTERQNKKEIKAEIYRWYKEYAEFLYKELVEKWATKLNIKKQIPLKIVMFPKRMGSCSINGELRFSIKSIMLPFEVVDYLALHEVAHLIHFNHAKEFKAILDWQMSEWKNHQKMMNRYRLVTAKF
jgi:predicted metal-dependent hydrolase